jgi:hypothetical protein
MRQKFARDMRRQRANTIARTETIEAQAVGLESSWNQAQEEGLIEEGTKKKWLSFDDSRTSNICLGLDGQTVDMGEPFASPIVGEIDHPPAHPNAVFSGSTFAPYAGLIEMVRADYRGPGVRIYAGNYRTVIGPNHPMLTSRGMVRAVELKSGDNLAYDERNDRTPMPKVEGAYSVVVHMSKHRIRCSDHELHGDRKFCTGPADSILAEEYPLPVFSPTELEQAKDGVLADYLTWVKVDRTVVCEFQGAAFDASTKAGLYCSDGFVVSNCRSTMVLEFPE